METLDIIDEQGNPTGQTIDRSIAHRIGILHRTAHVWLFRIKNGRVQVLLQKRSKNKDSYPGCYDISSAGHIPAGVDFITSALRELKEELGLTVDVSELIYCGRRRIQYKEEFYGVPFVDNQISNVYMIFKDIETSMLLLQEEEVEEVIWMDFNQCLRAVAENTMPHCIMQEELDILQRALEQQGISWRTGSR